jgi:hypothetical protein
MPTKGGPFSNIGATLCKNYVMHPVAEYSLLLGAKLKDVPPEIGTLQEVLAKYGLTAHG